MRVERADAVAEALSALSAHRIPVAIAGEPQAASLVSAVRGRADLDSTYVVVVASLDSPEELRAALDAGADDVMRVPFEPEALVARVAAGLRAARLRANEALLQSLVDNIPGALYRGACDADWTMHWLSDEVETITGYPASDFIENSVRTFASVIHPDDREQVERSVSGAIDAHLPFNLEYRIVRPDGEVRWVLERGQAQERGDGSRRLHGAIFDITVRRAAEEALREREVVQAQLTEVRASRARILDAADRARREIERNLHDGAQQRFVSATLQLQVWRASCGDLPQQAQAELDDVLAELRAGLAELRELAHGLHPAVLSDRGLERALSSLADHTPVPVELRADVSERLDMPIEAAAYPRKSRVGRGQSVRRLPARRGRRRRRRWRGPAARLGAAGATRPHRRCQRHVDHREPAGRRHHPAGEPADLVTAVAPPGLTHRRGVIARKKERRRPESNRCRRLCRPLRSHSATSPRSQRVAAGHQARPPTDSAG